MSVCVFASACRTGAEPSKPAPSAPRQSVDAEKLEDKAPAVSDVKEPLAREQYGIAQAYAANLSQVPTTYEALESQLSQVAPPSVPGFRVEDARFYQLLRDRLALSVAQQRQLSQTGFISVETSNSRSMGEAYRDIWQADLPVLVTTDSILHAWHRTFDVTLERLELTAFADSYLTLVREMQKELADVYPALPAEAKEAGLRVDVYLAVALTFLRDMKRDGNLALEVQGGEERAKMALPVFAPSSDVEKIVNAIYGQTPATVPHFDEVDFSQFKVRGHYSKNQALSQYFRAVMWLGRSDTGFTLVTSAGKFMLEDFKAAALIGLLAKESKSLGAFEKNQRAIDYFVGSANGISLSDAVSFVKKEQVTVVDLGNQERTSALAQRFAALGPATRVTSEALLSEGENTAAPLVFQLSSQRFVLDSYVHDQTSFDSVRDRYMVDALDVPAALGSGVATRLLKDDMARYPMVTQLGALRKTIDELPASYWDQNIYTGWLDALRILHTPPTGANVPRLFLSDSWQRKQLQTQLASWAELRRDTILYAAQSYGSVLCDFPAVYVEPYPRFYRRMEAMAAAAATRLDEPEFFRRFAEIMGQLARISDQELTGKPPTAEDKAFLKSVVKQHTVDLICAKVVEWTGWYKELFADRDPFKFEPVIADVYTDPNSNRSLNVGTTPVQLALVALETLEGPTLFVGPISGFRQFAGARMSDLEWQERIKKNQLPPAPPWTSSFSGGRARSPAPHP